MANNVLFVCSGNTCRSPIAQALTAEVARERGEAVLYNFDSAGISPSPKYPRTEGYAVEAVRALGVNPEVIGDRATKNVSEALADRRWDFIVVMEEQMKHAFRAEAHRGTRVLTIRELAGESGMVRDPLGGDIAEYQSAAKEILRLLEIGWRTFGGLAERGSP